MELWWGSVLGFGLATDLELMWLAKSWEGLWGLMVHLLEIVLGLLLLLLLDLVWGSVVVQTRSMVSRRVFVVGD